MRVLLFKAVDTQGRSAFASLKFFFALFDCVGLNQRAVESWVSWRACRGLFLYINHDGDEWLAFFCYWMGRAWDRLLVWSWNGMVMGFDGLGLWG